ncbi:YihY/virulence factor BrkB family protein [Roseiflexus sp.]|uniref:YihY/virulence factor BrkB family protein n=1 Tax=Roseiflexus sp. TaxID=2562120 RepID=UPI00398A9F6E
MNTEPVIRLIRLTLTRRQRDRVGDMAAAISFFAIFSIFPLLLVVFSIVGFIVDPQHLTIERLQIDLIVSPEIAGLIVQTLTHFSETRVGAGLLGSGTLLLSATGLLSTLARFFNQIWDVSIPNRKAGIKTTVVSIIVDRLTSFALLLGIAALILAAALGNLALSLLAAYTEWQPLNSRLIPVFQIALAVALLTVGFSLLYKVLPNYLPSWRDVWPAALSAAIAFIALQSLVGLIFAQIDFSSFGVLGSAMTLLLWIFLSFQIFLIGGELSYTWSHVFGSRKGVAAMPMTKAPHSGSDANEHDRPTD